MFVPQLLEEKNQQNLEFPRYHIVNTPLPVQDTLENKGRKYLCVYVCVCGDDTPGLYLIGYTHAI
jgi:hypothetical protein